MRYTLTKDFTKITTDYGLFQNVSGDANIEITDDIRVQGIILKPFQTVVINTKVYARRISGGGNCALAVLPFSTSETQEETTDTNSTDDTNTTATDSTTNNSCNCHEHKPPVNPYDVFNQDFFNQKPNPNFAPSFNYPPPPPPNSINDDGKKFGYQNSEGSSQRAE